MAIVAFLYIRMRMDVMLIFAQIAFVEFIFNFSIKHFESLASLKPLVEIIKIISRKGLRELDIISYIITIIICYCVIN